MAELPTWRLKRQWKIRRYCPECDEVKLFKRRPNGVWEDDRGHELDWHMDIISEMKKRRKKESKQRKKRKLELQKWEKLYLKRKKELA